MKPFDLELAKQGHPVVTRGGMSARIVCFDAKSPDYPLVGLFLVPETDQETHARYTADGHYWSSKQAHDYDLFMAPRKVTKWFNIFTYPNGKIYAGPGHDSADDAEKQIAENAEFIGAAKYIATKPIELEL